MNPQSGRKISKDKADMSATTDQLDLTSAGHLIQQEQNTQLFSKSHGTVTRQTTSLATKHTLASFKTYNCTKCALKPPSNVSRTSEQNSWKV